MQPPSSFDPDTPKSRSILQRIVHALSTVLHRDCHENEFKYFHRNPNFNKIWNSKIPL